MRPLERKKTSPLFTLTLLLTLVFIGFLYNLNYASAVIFTNVATNCTAENMSRNLPGNYTTACQDPSGSRLGLDDGITENNNYAKITGKPFYGGVRAQSVNSSITSCLNITRVELCYEWWATTATEVSCRIGVSNDSNKTITDISTTCPGTASNPGATCQNVTATKAWTCGNFFGTSSNRATAEVELAEGTNPGTQTVTVDVLYFNVTYTKSAPAITSITNMTTNQTATINWTTNELANSTINYGLTTTLGTLATNTTLTLNHSILLSNLVNNTQYFYNLTSCDAAGNCNTSGTFNFTTTQNPDTQPPSILFVNPAETSGSVLNRNNILANVTASDDGSGLRNVTTFLFNLTSLVSSNTSNTTPLFMNFTNLADGLYFFNATTFDNASNTNSTETRNATIDTAAPGITITAPINTTYNNQTQLINISTTGATNTWFTNATGQNETYTIPLFRTFNEGNNTLFAYTNDTAGNLNTTQVTFTIDTTPPAITGITNTTTNETATISWTTNEAANSTINYGLTLNLGTLITDLALNISHSLLITNLSNDTLYYYNVSSCDNAGNCNTTGTFNLTTQQTSSDGGGGSGGSGSGSGISTAAGGFGGPGTGAAAGAAAGTGAAAGAATGTGGEGAGASTGGPGTGAAAGTGGEGAGASTGGPGTGTSGEGTGASPGGPNGVSGITGAVIAKQNESTLFNYPTVITILLLLLIPLLWWFFIKRKKKKEEQQPHA